MIIFLFIMAVVTSGAIGFFLAYLKNEKESEELRRKSNVKSGKSGWYAYC